MKATFEISTSRGTVVLEIEGGEFLSAKHIAALSEVKPVEVSRTGRDSELQSYLSLVPSDALVAIFVCASNLPEQVWADLAWALRAESLQRDPRRATFFWPTCPFARLPAPQLELLA